MSQRAGSELRENIALEGEIGSHERIQLPVFFQPETK
jgi:hypothetical protein